MCGVTCANAERFELRTNSVAQLLAHLCVFVTHAFVSHLLKHLPAKGPIAYRCVPSSRPIYMYMFVCVAVCCSVL